MISQQTTLSFLVLIWIYIVPIMLIVWFLHFGDINYTMSEITYFICHVFLSTCYIHLSNFENSFLVFIYDP